MSRETTSSPPLRVAAAVIRRGPAVLIARRPPGDRHAGQWEFPGGKLEPGETPEACLVRELVEELALTCTIGPHLMTVVHRYPHRTIELIVHEASCATGTAQPSVHDAVLWVAIGELGRYDFAEADRPVVARLVAADRPDGARLVDKAGFDPVT